MPLGHTHMALDGPETNLHIVYASSIIDQHKEEVFEQYDFAGPVAVQGGGGLDRRGRRVPRAARAGGRAAGHQGDLRDAALTQGAVAPLLLISDNLRARAPPRCGARERDGRRRQVRPVVARRAHRRHQRVRRRAPFDAVGILDHGAPGRFCLLKSVGDGDIDLADLATDASIAAFLKHLGGLVKPGGRIDLLGCSVAAGRPALLAQVEALTGVNVTASTDKTGGAADADWVMETDNSTCEGLFRREAVKEWRTRRSRVTDLALPVPVGFGALRAFPG